MENQSGEMEENHLTPTSNNNKQPPQIFAVNVIAASEEKRSLTPTIDRGQYELESLSPSGHARNKRGLVKKVSKDGDTSRDFLMPESAAARNMAPNGNVNFKMKQAMSASTQNLKDNNNDTDGGKIYLAKSLVKLDKIGI